MIDDTKSLIVFIMSQFFALDCLFFFNEELPDFRIELKQSNNPLHYESKIFCTCLFFFFQLITT